MEDTAEEIFEERQDKIDKTQSRLENVNAKLKNLTHKVFTRKNIRKLVVLMILTLVAIPIFTYIIFARDLKDKNTIMNRNNSGLHLLDDQGEVFFTFYNPKVIDPIPLSEIPKDIQEAAIVAEDKDFYNNPGFSPPGIARAFLENLKSASISQGGSTITQQLVKNALLSSKRNFLRKYQEIILALEIERRYSKEDILEMYLNSVYFGEGAFGIENAAQEYFGKEAKNLTLAESSILAAILPAPSALSPRSGDIEAAEARQEIVLTKMLEAGYITESQKNQAQNAKLVIIPPKDDGTNKLAPHFAIFVKEALIKEYGEENITRQGFRVKTTLSRKWQQTAETAVKNQVNRLLRNKATNGAAVAIDPKTGQIKAYVGSHDWQNDQNGKLNMATAPRQPGSSFKPIIYSRALEEKLITAATKIEDKAVSFGTYKPKNYDNKFRGEVTVRRALANSLNIPAVKVMDMLGVKDGLDQAEELGITSLDKERDYGLPLVLGAGEVPLLEMTAAYATFANKGEYNEPNFILEIKDKNGKEIKHDKKNPRRAIPDGPAFLIASILSDTSARAEVFGGSLNTTRGAAVKTGTTEDYKDALTLGFTPNLAIGVWVGNNDNTPMDRVAGSSGAAPIFVQLMNSFSQDLPREDFRVPNSVVERGSCDQPGSSPSPNPTPNATPAPSVQKEYFLRGTEPPECVVPSPSVSPSPSPSATPEPSPSPTPAPTPTPEPSPSILVIPSPI